MPRAKVDPLMRAEFERERLAGRSVFDIHLDYDVCPGTVRYQTRHLKAHAGSGRPRVFDHARALRLARELSPKIAADRLGVSRSAIYHAQRLERLRIEAAGEPTP